MMHPNHYEERSKRRMRGSSIRSSRVFIPRGRGGKTGRWRLLFMMIQKRIKEIGWKLNSNEGERSEKEWNERKSSLSSSSGWWVDLSMGCDDLLWDMNGLEMKKIVRNERTEGGKIGRRCLTPNHGRWTLWDESAKSSSWWSGGWWGLLYSGEWFAAHRKK